MTFLIFIFGLCIGSFLNVIIYRWSRGLSIRNPLFSFCPHCGNILKWYHNIPIISYIILRGKCAYCKAPISLKYPLVELLTAFLFLWVYIKFKSLYGWFTFFGFAFYVLTLILTSFIDLEIREIPDKLSLSLIFIGWIFSLFGLNPFVDFITSLLSGFAGVGLLFLINELYYQFSKREGMGMGDFKLMGGIGAFLGYKSFYWILMLASITGVLAFFGVYLWQRTRGVNKKLDLKTEIPFGPFLALASLLYFLLI
ncbi:MAG: prepilin peptidase [Thermodesulfobacterium geofontis]|uniref:Prepilin leader peptidase/N-methyltransferase n=1 Tax=Thermodesulfobacterium geofontis TaxID=1295609 RepID=A0A2N7QC90_9BACT|nr:MAG: prepilin peptidase [Thermodesulfobacterium geofontis]